MSRILVVEDETPLRRALTVNLGARGYEVIDASDGETALIKAATENPDLVLLDLGLPGIDGLDVITGLRGWTSVPIIVLTVRDDQRTKVIALDGGADDYVTKPFGMDELLARVRVALRRNRPGDEQKVVTTGDWSLDLADRRATDAGGEPIRLTPTEWLLVEHLVRHADRLVTQRQLVTAVWGATYDPDPNLLRVHLTHIRQKLEPDHARPRYFVTEPGLGYRFIP
jgi:two-component system, OmpR family, KDP operon response regulator KdpE